jgi:hypothetical protein
MPTQKRPNACQGPDMKPFDVMHSNFAGRAYPPTAVRATASISENFRSSSSPGPEIGLKERSQDVSPYSVEVGLVSK